MARKHQPAKKPAKRQAGKGGKPKPAPPKKPPRKPPKAPPATASQPPPRDDYAKHRLAMAAKSSARSAAGRDIGDIPPILDIARRERCRDSLLDFCLTYNPEAFYLGFCEDALTEMRRVEEAVFQGAMYAFAEPRGSGKTTRCRMAILWAASYGHKRYPFLIGATDAKARATLDAVKMFIRFLPLFSADFPEISYPATALAGIANRASGQTCGGEPTMIQWSADRVHLPTVPPPPNWPKTWSLRSDGRAPTSGVIVGVSGLTGEGIRGSVETLTTGEQVRPDLVLIDDPQTAEALDVETPIPTPKGFVRMGDLRCGDTVFDDRGSPCAVLATSEIMESRKCYRVVFDDGSEVIADAGHIWETSTAMQRTNERRKVASPNPAFSTRPQCRSRPFRSQVTTEQIAATLRGEGDRANHSIPVAEPIDTPDAILPIPPYTLGAWLGDGASASGRFCTADPEILGYIAEEGFAHGKPCRKPGPANQAADYTLLGLQTHLRAAGLLQSKHLPAAYWFASKRQRLSVLQGLMDTDGTITVGTKGIKGIRCKFSNTNRLLIDAALHLCRSLGIKATCTPARDDRLGSAPMWNVNFITSLPVFRLKRKAARLPLQTKKNTRRRFIEAVHPIESRPVRCISVESGSKLYLCGEAMVPTHNSARSKSQNENRYRLIMGDVLGMAGPGRSLSCVMPCTVIARGDCIDRVLNRREHPLWRGERTKLLRTMPASMEAWNDYFDVYRQCALFEPPDFTKANEHYLNHREALDAGAEASWPERKLDWEVSAIQHAMHLYCRDKSAFMAEYQNDPEEEREEGVIVDLEAASVAERLNSTPRGTVPPGMTRLTAFSDVQQNSLWWVVCAWAEGFASGSVVDYGVYPPQPPETPYFTRYQLRKGLADLPELRGMDETARIYAGAKAVSMDLLGRTFPVHGGGEMKLDLMLIDSRYATGTIHSMCRESPHGPRLMPSMGYGIGASAAPMSNWPHKDGELRDQSPGGAHWVIRPQTSGGRGRQVVIDTNYWKTFVAQRLLTAAGGRGALRLFGDSATEHRLFADHLVSEYRVETEGRGRKLSEWKQRPERPDNDWWDALVGCTAAASVLRMVWYPGGAGPVPTVRPKIKMSEVYARKQREKGMR